MYCLKLQLLALVLSALIAHNVNATDRLTWVTLNTNGTNGVHIHEETPFNGGQSARIYNGDLSKRYSFMVAIVIITDTNTQSGYLHCGGTLINNRWVLTAGHCVEAKLKDAIHTNRAQAWVGAYDLGIAEPRNIRQQIKITRFVEPTPSFNPQTLANDIALLELESPVNWGANDFTTIGIGNKNYDDAQNMKLIGWGKVDCAQYPTKLSIANGLTLNNPKCAEIYGGTLEPSMICAFVKNGQGGHADQASGDSGGPLFYENNQGYYIQVGVVSFSRKLDNGCPVTRYPGVYTRVTNYINWITSVAGYVDVIG